MMGRENDWRGLRFIERPSRPRSLRPGNSCNRRLVRNRQTLFVRIVFFLDRPRGRKTRDLGIQTPVSCPPGHRLPPYHLPSSWTHLLAHGVDVVLEVAVFAEDGGSLAALLITDAVDIIQLRLQRHLQLLQLGDLRLGLLHLVRSEVRSEEVRSEVRSGVRSGLLRSRAVSNFAG